MHAAFVADTIWGVLLEPAWKQSAIGALIQEPGLGVSVVLILPLGRQSGWTACLAKFTRKTSKASVVYSSIADHEPSGEIVRPRRTN